jgi:hypothetical protein
MDINMSNYDRLILEILDRVSILEDEVAVLKSEAEKMESKPHQKTVFIENGDTEKYTPEQGSHRDTTKYLFGGKAYGKNRLVLAVIKKWVNDNPALPTAELMRTFDRSLQGSLGVIREIKDAGAQTRCGKCGFSRKRRN